MANPSGSGNHQVQTAPVASFLYGNVTGLKHNPGIHRYWSPEEQTILEERLLKYASVPNRIRCADIAPRLKDKTSREVALRVLWMKKNAKGKRRKVDHNLTRKSDVKKVKGSDPAVKPSQFAAQPIVSPYAPAMPMMDSDGVISYNAIGGVTGELLELNALALSQISNNLAFGQFQDNISLFCQIRDGVTTIYNDIDGMSELMKNMPPLPFTLNDAMLNDAIANSILLRTNQQMQPTSHFQITNSTLPITNHQMQPTSHFQITNSTLPITNHQMQQTPHFQITNHQMQ